MENANRGNVAIIAWNTMKAPCWDVSTTKLDGEVALSDARNTTLLSTHFRDYVYEDSEGNKYLKEAESFIVAKAPSMEKELGERQIVLQYLDAEDAEKYLDRDFAKFESAIKVGEPKRNVETSTYFDEEAANRLIAYVPEEVYADLETLYGREVTVIFGEDNEVALIIVTNDGVIDNDFVTKYNKEGQKLTIADNEYKILDTVEVYVNGVEFGTGVAQIEAVIAELGLDPTSTRTITKALKANVILTSKNKVERVDFTLSGEYFIEEAAFVAEAPTTGYIIEEKIVEDVKSKGDVKALGGGILYNYKDLIEEEEEPKVLKAGKEISLDEIAEGDVLTIVTAVTSGTKEIQTIYVSSEKVSGEVADVKRALTVKIDGTTYYAAKDAVASTTGDIEDAKTAVDYEALKNIDEETAELYLNILGEYSAIVCETEADNGVFAMIRRVGKLNDDADDEQYVKLYVTLTDGTETSYTVKYDDKASEHTTGTEYTLEELADAGNLAGKVIRADVNSEKLVLIEDIEFVSANVLAATNEGTTGTIDGTDVVAVTLSSATVEYDDKIMTATVDGDPVELDFSGAIYMNYNDEEVSIASKGWTTLVGKGATSLSNTKLTDAIFFVEDEDADFLDVKLVCASATDYIASDVQFAIVTNVKNLKKETNKEEITLLLANGTTATYEVGTEEVETGFGRIEVGDFVQFKASEDKITAGTLERVIDVVALTSVADDAKVADYINMNAYIKATAACGCDGVETAKEGGVCTGEAQHKAVAEGEVPECDCGGTTERRTEVPTDPCNGVAHKETGCACGITGALPTGVTVITATCTGGTHQVADCDCGITGTLPTGVTVIANVCDGVGHKATNCACGGTTERLETKANTTPCNGDPAHVAPTVDKKSVLTAVVESTTKEHLIFEYDSERATRVIYTDAVDNKLSYVRISDDGAKIFDLRDMDLDSAEGVAFLTDANLEELDGERIIAIDVDPDETGAELLVVVSAK